MAYTLTNTSASLSATRPSFDVFAMLQTVLVARKQRRQLAKLPAHMLHDIGLTNEDVAEELARPLWSTAG